MEWAQALQKLTLPDEWQARAIRGLVEGLDVVVQAPTGAGKTFVFEQWYGQRRAGGGQVVFTVPTRALANDKYAEWQRKGWRVGITTGDVVIDPAAPLVVATLEAQQDSEGVALYAIDEYQWLGDAQRGHHYEGVIMSLPASTQLLLLSGSVANPAALVAWLGRLGRRAILVEQRERPVPLDEVDLASLARGVPERVQGFWPRCLAGALREGLGPVLVFAPARRQAESIARQFAAQVPAVNSLALTPDQAEVAGPELAKLLAQRVAYHHSGLSYSQRAGLIEPLAKGGQLRVVVATLGLSAGINFSLRSVLVTGTQYQAGGLPREVTSAELLQMFGRAGRRGLDEQGYVLVTDRTPRLGQATRAVLRRSTPLPWRPLLRRMGQGMPAEEASAWYRGRLFTDEHPLMGIELTAGLGLRLPCGLLTDTGRARLVRREGDPGAATGLRKANRRGKPSRRAAAAASRPGFCIPCVHRAACLELDPRPTLLWQWNRLGMLDRDLALTRRGRFMASFVGPEGLGVLAGLEDTEYPVEDLLTDAANLFAGDRFCGSESRYAGRLAHACGRAFRRFSWEGFLIDGLPVHYGAGASAVARAWRDEGGVRRHELPEEVRRGDIDRLLIEWRSLLRQVGGVSAPWVEPDGAEPFRQRLERFQALCREEVARQRLDALPELPALTAEQRKPVARL